VGAGAAAAEADGDGDALLVNDGNFMDRVARKLHAQQPPHGGGRDAADARGDSGVQPGTGTSTSSSGGGTRHRPEFVSP
jgi:hypothetical protein